jgi:hypothetical protein
MAKGWPTRHSNYNEFGVVINQISQQAPKSIWQALPISTAFRFVRQNVPT